MIVGFDYWNTITEHSSELSAIARSLVQSGHNIHIISAISTKTDPVEYLDLVKNFLKEIDFPYDQIHLVVFKYSTDVPKLKLTVALKHKIRLFVDDREDVCQIFRIHGIGALKSVRLKDRKYLHNGLDETVKK